VNHGNGSYTVVPFDRPDAATRKFLAQDMYALPPQILPCDQVDLLDLRYMNNDFAPITHPFKDSFNIESYNSIWFEEQPPSSKPVLKDVCKESLPPPIEGLAAVTTAATARPDTIEEMDTSLTDNTSIASQVDAIVTETPLTPAVTNTAESLWSKLKESVNKLCFIAYRGANTLKPKWFLVQVDITDDATAKDDGVYFVNFFRCHPSDEHKPHDCARYWPDWYEIVWTDSRRVSFDYGKPILVRPSRKPNIENHCRFSDSVCLLDPDVLLIGPFDFAAKARSVPASQMVTYEFWDKLSPVCNDAGLVPPKLANNPVLATNTIAIVSSTNSVKWYHSSIQYICKVLDARKK